VTVPGGTVVLSSEGAYLGTAFLNGGSGKVSINSLPYQVGTYTVLATYSGDTYNSSTTGSEVVSLTKANTAVSVSGPSTVVQGQTASYAVTVTRPNLQGTPAGTIYLLHNGGFIAQATLSNGTATLTANTSGIPVGTYSVVVAYSGGPNNSGSSSAPFTVTVTAP
jgi:hypothetical protein